MGTHHTGPVVGWLAKVERFVVRYGVEPIVDAVADLAEGPWACGSGARDEGDERRRNDGDG